MSVPVCPHDQTPLVWSFEKPGAEYHCLRCGRWLGMLKAHEAEPTDERTRLADHVNDLFRDGKRGPIADEFVYGVSTASGDTIKCDGCGKDSGRTVEQGKPAVWYQRRDRDTGQTQTACSRPCIDTIAAEHGTTRVVLPW